MNWQDWKITGYSNVKKFKLLLIDPFFIFLMYSTVLVAIINSKILLENVHLLNCT